MATWPSGFRKVCDIKSLFFPTSHLHLLCTYRLFCYRQIFRYFTLVESAKWTHFISRDISYSFGEYLEQLQTSKRHLAGANFPVRTSHVASTAEHSCNTAILQYCTQVFWIMKSACSKISSLTRSPFKEDRCQRRITFSLHVSGLSPNAFLLIPPSSSRLSDCSNAASPSTSYAPFGAFYRGYSIQHQFLISLLIDPASVRSLHS
jgi:hypothetical protein